ncbi:MULTISPECIES: FAD-dependent oxidoreductase [Thermomonas]|jgi:glycine/D-amino acid oxidase-like deaminating enzyme/nitrite reductase/ring-hydroxylating ferredoxin subunit|uniref:FAD-dependent oxidoreductase n=1 Tax=Thermomonas TaxID=141948 RepID=UPI0003FC9429|nr:MULTISPECIES: FAD-dependent oxidoreductase [Thermomonas]
MNSLWTSTSNTRSGFESLKGTEVADVAVVGGGITGVTTALRLAEAGMSVALVESARIGAGNTGRSTGNLYATLSHGLATLLGKWGEETLRSVVRLRGEAVAQIARDVETLRLDCDFERVDLHIGLEQEAGDALQALREEFAALALAGLAPDWVEPPLAMASGRMLRIRGQAQCNPCAYVQALAAQAQRRGARLFEETRVIDIDASDGRVRTTDGEISAGAIVIATHSPIGFNLVQAEMQPCIEYGISARVEAGAMPSGIFWFRDGEHSLRRYRHAGVEHLVVIGEPHRTGEQEPEAVRLERLRGFARRHFGVETFEHCWSAQQLRSADGLPYIGRSAHDNVFIATGFAADGLTWGTVAAGLIRDLVQDKGNPAVDLLSPRRLTPVKSAKGWAEENAAVVKHLVGDRLRQVEPASLSSVAPGQGKLVDHQGKTFAVYRASDGTLTVLSPVCPHLRCHVAWNPEQPGWDCPCHGSRFHPDGRVLDGPALSDLERLRLEDAR